MKKKEPQRYLISCRSTRAPPGGLSGSTQGGIGSKQVPCRGGGAPPWCSTVYMTGAQSESKGKRGESEVRGNGVWWESNGKEAKDQLDKLEDELRKF